MTTRRFQPRFDLHSASALWCAALWGALALIPGCAEDGGGADGVAVLTPSTVSFPWDDAFDLRDDGVVAFVPFDVMVYRSSDGLPVARAEVEMHAEGAELVSPAAVGVVGGEGEGCPVGAFGDACVWDVFGDALVRVDPAALPTSSYLGETDSAGLLRVYAVVDTTDDELRVSAHVLNRRMSSAPAELDASTSDAASWTQLIPR